MTRYEVEVVATDEAVQSERRSSSAVVVVLGLEGEEEGPACSLPSPRPATVTENAPIGTFLTTLALDPQVCTTTLHTQSLHLKQRPLPQSIWKLRSRFY